MQIKSLGLCKTKCHLGETELICWSTGPTGPILSKNKKNTITKFWPTRFSIIYYFLLFEKK